MSLEGRLEELREFACDEGQGFLFAYPQPAEAVDVSSFEERSLFIKPAEAA